MSDIVIIGDYELLKKQNDREWFDEYKARNRNTNEIVLMARVKNGLDVEEIESRFPQPEEYESEHLMRYIDVVKKDDELWIVMENCDCFSLAQLLEHKDYVTVEQLREIARGCLLGLKYLHESGIMHGDVRPVNLFLTKDGVLKLGYYGLITQAECYSIKEDDCEGVRSFAPEVFDGYYRMKSDVWSFGISLMEMMGITAYCGYRKEGLPTMTSDYELPFDKGKIESAELADFLEKCFVKYSRWSVNELMDHQFVMECEEEDNEMLIPLVKILKYQEYCEWILKKNMEDSHLLLYEHDRLCSYHEGLIEKADYVVMELRFHGVTKADVDSCELMRVNGKDVKGSDHNVVLDLSDDGERWEGDVLDNQPYGWGVLYNSENRMVYEGFRIGEVNVCYGTRYYSDIGVIEYVGGWFEGKRWGGGIQYDRTGKEVFAGEWVRDEPARKRVVLSKEDQLLHNHIEELIVSNSSCNGEEWTALDLSLMPDLRLFEVGDDCFVNVKEMKMIGLKQLERVVIGEKCFTKCKNKWNYDPNRVFSLKNCERLKELKMGCYSFSDYGVCQIENVPSLEVIEMGELNKKSGNFRCSSLKLKNIPSLKTLLFGECAFSYGYCLVLENLPELTSIRLGESAFGCREDDSTELVMRNLPKLTSLTTEGDDSWSFFWPHSVTLENMPSLATVNLPSAFKRRNHLSYCNIGELMNHPSIPKPYPNANIHSIDEIMTVEKNVEVLIVDTNSCNNNSYTALDLSGFSNLKVFEVGDYSFTYVEEVELIGLNQLERVVIGENCFTKFKCRQPYFKTKRHFYLKKCERLRELKIGCYSFSDYSVCVIERMNRLEVIAIGELKEVSDSFCFASRFELSNLAICLFGILFNKLFW